MTRRNPEVGRATVWLLTLIAPLAAAQSTSGLQPRLSVDTRWTDNLRLTPQDKDAAVVTTVSPGLSISSRSGAVRGNLDYALNGIAYLKTDQTAEVRHTLSATGVAELVANRVFVDARATIGQQAVSAFGTQSATPTPTPSNANQREVMQLSLSPYARGSLGGWASYELRADYNRVDARGSSLGDGQTRGGSLRISSTSGGPFGWGVTARTQQSLSALAAGNRSSSLTGSLNYRPDVDWSLALNAGQERNDYLSGAARNGPTTGLNANWTPTPRTRLGADWQHHDYGNTHSFNLEHRFSRSVWRLVDSRSLNLGNAGLGGGVRSNYDQYYLLFASQEPDPIKRDALVRSYLLAFGLLPDAPAASGFLSAGPSRQRSQQFSVALQGVRSTLTLLMSRSVSSRLAANTGVGDLASSSEVAQRSFSLSAGHRLTPTSSLSLTVSRQDTDGDLAAQSTQLTSVVLGWNGRLGSRLVAQLGARHSQFESVQPYTENSVYATLTQQF
jgi:uncharacterized protein (PEP-CTERM system associated)